MKVEKVFCADGNEFICITFTDFSLQPVTTETGFDSRLVQVIFVVITVKLGQGFILVLPLCFQCLIIDISYPFPCCCYKNNTCERPGNLQTKKKKMFFCHCVTLERKVLIFISAGNVIPVITGGSTAHAATTVFYLHFKNISM